MTGTATAPADLERGPSDPSLAYLFARLSLIERRVRVRAVPREM